MYVNDVQIMINDGQINDVYFHDYMACLTVGLKSRPVDLAV